MEVALFLDFDGTIVRGSSWDAVRARYGMDSGWLERFLAGKVSLEELFDHDMKQILPLLKEEHVDEISRRLEKVDGFDEFATEYFPRFGRVAILSGGFPHILERFARDYGLEVYGPTYRTKGGKFRGGNPMGGDGKLEVLREEAGKNRIVYVADDPLPGYEKEDYGPGVLRICMGRGQHEHVVHNFHELGRLLDDILEKPAAYFK